MILDIHEFDRIRIVGDRVLIRPRPEDEQTRSGLFLPPGIEEQEPAASGYVLKVGPGFPMPSQSDDEPWKQQEDVRYIPLQAKTGDLAVYLRKQAISIAFNDQNYVIVPQHAILMLYRDDGLFED
ncbi:MAG: co-chaperone GroES [Ignavibacteria bacterium]|jgi:co-chaperonin GroES (HSP10)|nr:chaperonin [Chlorobiota bacterium]